jgi:hypothetical protein
MGGSVPFGYDRKSIVNEAEASTVRMIFQRYAELGSVALLKTEFGPGMQRHHRPAGVEVILR